MAVRSSIVVVCLVVMGVACARSLIAAPGWTASSHGVKVWLSKDAFKGDPASLPSGQWQSVSVDKLPRSFRGGVVIGGDVLAVVMDADKGRATVYTRKGDRLTKRGAIASTPTQHPVACTIVSGNAKRGIGVRVRAAGKGDGPLLYTLHLSKDGIIEYEPAATKHVAVSECSVRYGIVPSFVGTDLVFDPRKHAGKDTLHLPSMNLLVGLVEGEGCAMVGTWPRGRQTTSVGLVGSGEHRRIDSFAVDTAGTSFYLSFPEHPNLWHVEELKDRYLERNTEIGWRRPFDAAWIGWMRVKSEAMHYPFYFVDRMSKMWGRWIRGWYVYPVWFDGAKTIIHCEKKFPPPGELLIYALEGPQRGPSVSGRPLMPVEVMIRALGQERAEKLLDLDGTHCGPELRAVRAVCGNSRRLEAVFIVHKAAKKREFVAQVADEIHTFIREIRRRAYEYDEFAKDTRRFLADLAEKDAEVVEAFGEVSVLCDEMRRKVTNVMPRESLDDVRKWTEQIKRLVDKPDKGKVEAYLAFVNQCIGVAGTQDDLVRLLAIRGIRIIEASGTAGVDSAERAELARQIIARARGVLRHPFRIEARRDRRPILDPGKLE